MNTIAPRTIHDQKEPPKASIATMAMRKARPKMMNVMKRLPD